MNFHKTMKKTDLFYGRSVFVVYPGDANYVCCHQNEPAISMLWHGQRSFLDVRKFVQHGYRCEGKFDAGFCSGKEPVQLRFSAVLCTLGV